MATSTDHSESNFLSVSESHRLQWRSRRGLLENDLLLERFFQTYGKKITQQDAQAITELMLLEDADLLDILLRRKNLPDHLHSPEIHSVLHRLRP